MWVAGEDTATYSTAQLPVFDPTARSARKPGFPGGGPQLGRWTVLGTKWWKRHQKIIKKNMVKLWFQLWVYMGKLYMDNIPVIFQEFVKSYGVYINRWLNWWFGLVRWIPGIPFWKGLLLRGTPVRILNHRAPNHKFTISWWWKHQKKINMDV